MATSKRKANPKGRPVYIIEVKSGGRWKDTGEGPWRQLSQATRFAESEVGLEWRVVALYGKSEAFFNRNEV
jgi:hypothetical protein